MSARKHLSPYQYKLFMTGDEIKGLVSDSVDRQRSYTDVDYDTGENVTVPEQTMGELWATKESESKGKDSRIGGSLKDLISHEGVLRHVTIVPEHDGTFTMGQGHHRVAAASALAREGKEVYVPVMYHPDFNYTGDETGEYAEHFPHVMEEYF